MTFRHRKPLVLLLLIAACSWELAAQAPPPRLNADLLNTLTYRNLGPFRAGAWVTDIAVPETPKRAHQYTMYAGVRHGGVWKSINNGVTFEPVFDAQGSFAIGSLAVAPSDQNVVWVGTGDNSAARSAYSGDGVYKSTDAGKTWQNMGLKNSQHIGRIVIHPMNPDIVWVAAMGALFSPNPERGVFKTTDGGKTWRKVLYSGEHVGGVDLVLDRRNPDVLYAAAYEHFRQPWKLNDGGPASGVHKSVDGGNTWTRLAGGLPTGKIGRIGLDICRKSPDVLYAVVDNMNPPPGAAPQNPQGGRGQFSNIIGGEVYRTDDAGRTWRKMNSDRDDVSRKSGYAFNQIRVDPNNPDRIYITGSNMIASADGGKTWAGLGAPGGGRGQGAPPVPQARPFARAFGDFRTFWIDHEDSDRMLAGSDGGVYQSYDGGRTCDHLRGIKAGEVYALTVDMEQPYNIYAGLQDHEHWKAPVNGPNGSVGLEDWTTVGTGDGMYLQVDPTDSRWVYTTQEFGSPRRVDQKTHTRKLITPRRAEGQPRLRVNWVAPIRLSPHDPKIVYFGAEQLFRSKDRGDSWEAISPDLTTNNPQKISAGPSIQHCTITTISESPAQAGVIWVGTDDGKVQVTRDAGAAWTDVTAKIAAAGGPEDAWVTRVFGSHHQAGTAYVSKTRHRQDDFRPFVFKTTDFGMTWKAIHAGLPDKPVNVVFEDNVNPNLLVAGNDIGVFVSMDGGMRWTPLRANMPPAPVHDLVIHPREGDLVAGTYGRGVWVTNITPLREINEELLARDMHLFAVRPFAQRKEGAWGNFRLYGDNIPTTPNEPNGMTFVYYVREPGAVTLTITDSANATIRTINGQARKGLNRLIWDLDDAKGGPAAPGEYAATLAIGEKKATQPAKLLSRAPDDEPRERRFRPPIDR